jgi:Family of unknown function (DUF6527)
MSAFGTKLRTLEGGMIMFRCPACRTGHQVGVEAPATVIWGFNGNGDRPTFTPSVLVRGTQIEVDAQGKWTGNWIKDADGNPKPSICHSFVTDGRIQFLGDCTHAMAGQTVDLPDCSA